MFDVMSCMITPPEYLLNSTLFCMTCKSTMSKCKFMTVTWGPTSCPTLGSRLISIKLHVSALLWDIIWLSAIITADLWQHYTDSGPEACGPGVRTFNISIWIQPIRVLVENLEIRLQILTALLLHVDDSWEYFQGATPRSRTPPSPVNKRV